MGGGRGEAKSFLMIGKSIFPLSLLLTLSGLSVLAQKDDKPAAKPLEKTAFQTSSPWRPEIDVRSDIAIVYGANDRANMTFEERVKSWRDHNYLTHFMTGIAW